MPKRVLDVGNCDLDHGTLAGVLRERFSVDVVRCHTAAEADKAVRTAVPFDLVILNRIFDRDGDEGIEWIRRLKADPALAATPCLLLSNYAEYQAAATAAGAEPGFGKSQWHEPATQALLAKFLS